MRLDLPPPANDEDFPLLCLALLQAHWRCPQLELYAHRGEAQHGVDIFDASGDTPLRGGQCKRHGQNKAIEPSEIRSEVEKAKSFTPALGHYAILTTAKKSRAADDEILRLNQEHRKAGLFSVELFTWDKIQDLLAQHPGVHDRFYGDIPAPVAAEIRSKIDAVYALLDESSRSSTSVGFDAEIDEARDLIDRDPQMARLLLERLHRHKWDKLTDRQRYRVLANVGATYFKVGDFRNAGRYYIDAANHQLHDVAALARQVVGYEFLEDRETATRLATEYRKRFPTASDFVASLIRLAPDADAVSVIVTGLQAPHTLDPEVQLAIAQRSLIDSDYANAVACARRAVELQPEWWAARVLLAQALLQCALASAQQRQDGLPAISDPSLLQEAERALDAVALHGDLIADPVRADAILLRSQARRFLNKRELAAEDIREAHRLRPSHSETAIRFAIHLHEEGNPNEAIRVLRRAGAVRAGDDSTLLLSQMLDHRNHPGDRDEAIELAQLLVHTSDSRYSSLTGVVAHLAQMLLRSARTDDVRTLLTGQRGRVSVVIEKVLLARAAMSDGDTEVARTFAETAVEQLSDESDWIEVRSLALLLTDIGQFKEALTLWRRTVIPGDVGPDTWRLLECAKRIGRHDVILDVCRKAREAGHDDAMLLHDEVVLLERYDLEEAIRVLQAHLTRHPENAHTRIHLSAIGLTHDRPELATSTPDNVPLVDTDISAEQGLVVVQVLRRQGFTNDAVRYAYALLRRFSNDPKAHVAYIYSMIGPGLDEPTIPPIDSVEPGAAVRYQEGHGGSDHWVIIDEEHAPDTARREVAPSDHLAIELIGKKVGDRFVIAKGSVQDREGNIQEVLSKYVFQFQDCLSQFQVRFPGEAAIEQISIPQVEDAPDLTNIKAMLDRNAEQTRELEQWYREQPIPLHSIAELKGRTLLEVIQHFASQAETPIRCCRGSLSDRDEATSAFATAQAVVLDASALATLFLLDAANVLEHFNRHVIVGQGTMKELRSWLETVSDRKESGYFFPTETGVAIVEEPEERRAARKQALQAFLDRVQPLCRIEACPELAAIEPERRDDYVKFFGNDGAEAIVLAARPGRVLWTDDFTVAGIARSEFGIRRLWTQLALSTQLDDGRLDADKFVDMSARLIGWGYEFTGNNLAILIRAGEIADWDVDRWPFTQVIAQLQAPSLDDAPALQLCAGLIVHLYQSSLLRQRIETVILRLLETLSRRQHGIAIVGAIERVTDRLFGLDVVHAHDARLFMRAWLVEARRRPQW